MLFMAAVLTQPWTSLLGRLYLPVYRILTHPRPSTFATILFFFALFLRRLLVTYSTEHPNDGGSMSARAIGTTQTPQLGVSSSTCPSAASALPLVVLPLSRLPASAWFCQPGLSTLGLSDHRRTVLISVVVRSGMTYDDRNQDSPPITSDPVSIRVPYSLTTPSQAYPDAPFPGGTRVNIPHRDSRMPTLWRVDRHPTIPLDARVDGCLMFWMNTKEDVLGALYSYLKAVDIPEGSRDAMQSAGYLALDLYWYIFARDINGSHDPKDDVLQLWLIARSGMPDWVFQRFRLARDADLGPAEERTPNKPHKVNGEFTQEGVHYERSPLANSLEKNDRAYPLTMSYEQTRKLSGPCVGTKFEEEVSEHNTLHSETVAAAAEVAMCSLDVAPPQIKEHLDEQANLLNVPSVGSTRNTAFPFMQMNLMTPPDRMLNLVEWVASTSISHDVAGGITSMITDSDIDSDTEDWGWFAICDLGIAIELREFIVANFCGLRFHGGFAPTAKPGFAPKPWSHRFTVVCYLSAPILEGTSCLAYGALPKNNEFPLAPEMILPRDDDESIRVNHATWLREGALLTPAIMFLQWFFQSVVQILYYFVRQIPAHLDVQIDFDRMAECFSARDPDDPSRRITAHPWKYRSDAKVLREQRKFVPKGVLLKLGQDVRSRAKALALGTWEVNASNPGKSSTASASHKHTRRGSKKSMGRKIETRSQAKGSRGGILALNGHNRVQMSHIEVSPLDNSVRQCYVNTSHLLNDDDDEWVDEDAEDEELDVEMVDEVLGRSLDSDRDDGRSFDDDSDHRDGTVDTECQGTIVASSDSSPDRDMYDDDAEGSSNLNEDVEGAANQNHDNVEPSPPFRCLLESFSMKALQMQLARYTNVVASVAQSISDCTSDSRAIDDFINQYQSTSRSSPQFVYALDRIWPALYNHDRALQCLDLRIALERRRHMLTNAMAWRWLTEDRVAKGNQIAARLCDDPQCLQDSTDWFTRLVRDVYQSYLAQCAVSLCAKDYLPDLHDPDQVWDVRSGPARAFTCPIMTITCDEVVDLLAAWLHFPNNTSRISAAFVTRLVQSTGNIDILLLDQVWNAHQTVISTVLGCKGRRLQNLTVDMLSPFSNALEAHAIANRTSDEAKLLSDISRAVELCSRGLQLPPSWLSSSCEHLLVQNIDNIFPPIPQPHPTPRTFQDNVYSPGLESLLRFIKALLPIVRPAQSSRSTPLQSRVQSNLDFYLPFRELAPSRQIAKSAVGPCSALNMSSPGAFASTVIFRDIQDWNADIDAHGFDTRSPDADPEWRTLCQNQPLNFDVAYKWILRSRRYAEKGGRVARKVLPLMGALQGYLLMADLAYTGQVALPDVRTIGAIVSNLKGKGAWRGLHQAGLLTSPMPTKDEVQTAFGRVYDFLESQLTQEEQDLICFDAIMVEHTLCKYQRLMRDMKARCGSGEF
ncbi:hypothetical protein LXA43DRAFT_1067802 [Ganoderma leucocontextum]|nr:hypothetical protein LXA43DRAFT_1067802 [Ganoderma leucocontextum]